MSRAEAQMVWRRQLVRKRHGQIWGRRVSVLRRLVRTCHMQVPDHLQLLR